MEYHIGPTSNPEVCARCRTPLGCCRIMHDDKTYCSVSCASNIPDTFKCPCCGAILKPLFVESPR